ncbi:BTAD domain-containing putative transcriptional regulator [Nocardia heshunensis]
MQIALLGPITVTADGRELPLGGPRVKALLTLLAMDPGRPVPATRLIDGIWAEDLPTDATNALHTLIKRLRVRLPHHVIRRGSSYGLTVEPDSTDAHRFTTAVTQARTELASGRHTRAVECLNMGLDLWRGPALGGAHPSPTISELTAGLTEQRLTAIELRADAFHALGRSGELIHQLTAEVSTHPFRETLIARLIRALATVGRSAEALQTYQRAESLLHDELRIAPSPALHQAMTQIPSTPPAHAESRAADPQMPTRPWVFVSATRALDTPLTTSPLSQATSDTGNAGSVVPQHWTSFVGRTEDLTGLHRSLDISRLVTLVGAGGVGKTRLVTQLLRTTGRDQSAGCAFVSLAAVDNEHLSRTEASTIGNTILAALEPAAAAIEPRADYITGLKRSLSGRRMLLVLDNCEHIAVPTAAVVAELLQQVPDLNILAISREALGIEGERLYPLRPLPVPEHDATLTQAIDNAAMRLFVERAVAVRPDFVLTEDNYTLVCDLVCDLDGLPLAIELAAARVQALPLSEIAARLTDRFTLLTSTARHTIPRHRTLHAAVAWSWELLTEPEAHLARQFSVFVDGADLDAITATCGTDTLDALTSLVAKSLIEFDGERYRMVETIRAYAAGQSWRPSEANHHPDTPRPTSHVDTPHR